MSLLCYDVELRGLSFCFELQRCKICTICPSEFGVRQYNPKLLCFKVAVLEAFVDSSKQLMNIDQHFKASKHDSRAQREQHPSLRLATLAQWHAMKYIYTKYMPNSCGFAGG